MSSVIYMKKRQYKLQSLTMHNTTEQSEKRVIRVLAHAKPDALARQFEALPELPHWQFIRKPEAGLVMVRGRIGGTGGPFNFGEVTVTRAAISLETGETGFSYALGRDKKKAEQAAIVHAIWKQPQRQSEVEQSVIVPLEQELEAAEVKTREEVAPTKVEFYTMVRGDD